MTVKKIGQTIFGDDFVEFKTLSGHYVRVEAAYQGCGRYGATAYLIRYPKRKLFRKYKEIGFSILDDENATRQLLPMYSQFATESILEYNERLMVSEARAHLWSEFAKGEE